MNQELKMLEEILKRNSDEPSTIDIENEVEHYLIFDRIENEADLEAAWSLFTEHREIRKRLALIESSAAVVPGWGYRLPNNEKSKDDDAGLIELIRSHITGLRPIIINADYNQNVCRLIDDGFDVEIAPSGVAVPDIETNELFGALYEAIQEFKFEHFPYEKEHYEVLNNWATHLTKCDEVAAYLLSPCFEDVSQYDDRIFEYGMRLWKADCRDRFWVKDADFSSKTIYCRPPWLD